METDLSTQNVPKVVVVFNDQQMLLNNRKIELENQFRISKSRRHEVIFNKNPFLLIGEANKIVKIVEEKLKKVGKSTLTKTFQLFQSNQLVHYVDDFTTEKYLMPEGKQFFEVMFLYSSIISFIIL